MPSKRLASLAALACVAADEPPALAGMWGAGDALMALDAQGGRLQTGCTLVRFAPIKLGADGQFRTSAQAEKVSVMPLVSGGEDDADLPEPASQPASLTGRIGGGTADLSLTVEGQAPLTLHLILGQRSKPARCL